MIKACVVGIFAKIRGKGENDRQSREEREIRWSLPFSCGLDATFPSALQRNHTGKGEIQMSFTRQKPHLSGRLSAVGQSRGRAGKQVM